MPRIRRSHVVAVFVGLPALGLLIFGFLSSRVTTLNRASPEEASRRISTLREMHRSAPILDVAADGTVARRERPPEAVLAGRLSRLHVVVYHRATQRLVESRVPFWFFRLKARAAQGALEGTGLDLERMGVTAAELERYGPRVVLDHRRSSGDVVFVWTE